MSAKLLRDVVPQTPPLPGFANRLHLGTSVPEIPCAIEPQMRILGDQQWPRTTCLNFYEASCLLQNNTVSFIHFVCLCATTDQLYKFQIADSAVDYKASNRVVPLHAERRLPERTAIGHYVSSNCPVLRKCVGP